VFVWLAHCKYVNCRWARIGEASDTHRTFSSDETWMISQYSAELIELACERERQRAR
jgi:hypothetical protein